MPVMECSKDGRRGHRWGKSGACFTGADSRERAAAVGQAIHAQKAFTTQKSVADVEGLIGDMLTTEVLRLSQILPPAPENFLPSVREPGVVRKSDEDLRIVWSEVYIPDFPDAHDDFMNAEEIRKMAHNFIGGGSTDQCDLQHDNKTDHGIEVVESFIARKDDTIFIPGAWVVGVRVNDDNLWEAIKSGEFNGFSMQAKVYTKEVEVELDIPAEVEGQTDRDSDDPKGGHRHVYKVRFDDNGEFRGGETDTVDGHFHRILAGTLTATPIRNGMPEDGGHVHRYSFLDKLFGVPLDSEGRESLIG